MRLSPRIGLLACGCALVAACSPYVYQDEVRGFATGVDNLSAAYTESLTAANTATRSAALTARTANRARLGMSPGCASVSVPQACDVQEGPTPTTPSPIMADVPRVGPILAVIKDYAAALTKIVDATDRTALDKATGEAKSALIGLAEEFDANRPPGTPTAAGRAGALAGLFGQAAAAGLDQRRYQALRESVVVADPDIAILATRVIGPGLNNLALERFRLAHLEAGRMQTAFLTSPAVSDADYQSRAVAFETKLAEMQGLKTGKPSAATDQMVKAHNALRAALEDPSTQLADVTKAVKDFITQTKAVRDAFKPPAAAGSEK